MALTRIGNQAITLDATEIPNIPADKITSGSMSADRIGSGTFADARIAASNVSQHATSFDDNKIVNDISTLGLRVHSQENLNASNSNSASFDVFQDSSAISNLTNVGRDASSEHVSTSVIASGSYETGNRISSYTLTKNNMTTNSATLTGILDGAISGSPFYWSSNGQSADANAWFLFDLGSGNSKVYTGAKWYSDNASSAINSGVWQWQVSNDNSNYTNVGNTFNLNSAGGVDEVTWTNTTAYRYIRINGVSGGLSHNYWNREVEFRVGSSSFSASGSFTGNNITASSSTNKMGAVITYAEVGTNALNTDIVLQLSADGGSNYSTATMTALPDFATGIKMAKVNDLSVTSGNQLNYKISFANQSSGSKEARIRGISLQY